jgi:hypothetical protein
MIVTNLTARATAIWDALPGDFDDKDTLLKSLLVELREVRNAAKAARVKPVTPRRGYFHIRRSVEEVVAAAVGQRLRDLHTLRVPICGVNLQLNIVFAIAEQPANPLQEACKAFLAEHRLTLVEAPRSQAKGPPPRVVARLEDGE